MSQAMQTLQPSPVEVPSVQPAPGNAQRTFGARSRMEHRWGERIPVRASVRVHCAKWDAAGQLRDASLSGAFVHTRLQVTAWTHVELELSGVRIAAFVVRVAGDGLGVEWCEFAPLPIRELLRALIQRPAAVRERSVPAGGRMASVALTAGRSIMRAYQAMTRGLSRSLTISA